MDDAGKLAAKIKSFPRKAPHRDALSDARGIESSYDNVQPLCMFSRLTTLIACASGDDGVPSLAALTIM